MKWHELASQDMTDPSKSDGSRGTHTMRTILQLLNDHFTRIWEVRNDALHNTREAAMREIQSAETHEIRYYHGQPHLLCFADRHYCDRPLETLQNSPASTRRRWLRRVKKSVHNASLSENRQRLITSFFRKRGTTN